jgi:hypothetical protein
MTYEMVLDGRCQGSPETVYAVLADLSTHLDWGGRRQRRSFRLASLDNPAGPLDVGTEFTSVGTMPMTRARANDRSVVVRAEPSAVLEFHTTSTAAWPGGLRTEARWEHEYTIEPDGTGSRVTYRLRGTGMSGAPLRMRAPVMRTVTHKVMIPFLCRRGFVNLLRSADRWPQRGDSR